MGGQKPHKRTATPRKQAPRAPKPGRGDQQQATRKAARRVVDAAPTRVRGAEEEGRGSRPPFLDRQAVADASAAAGSGGAQKPQRGLFRGRAAKDAQGRQRPEPTGGDARAARRRRIPFVITIVVVAILVTVAISYAILTNTSAFVIRSIVCDPTEHVTAEDIATLAAVPEGTTLLNYDAAAIEQNLKRNPWVGKVECFQELPDRLRIEVTERTVAALVPLSSGSVVWCLGSDDVWIEPIKVVQEGEETIAAAALSEARARGALLIADVGPSVSPVAGTPADDDVFAAIATYRMNLGAGLWSQVVSISAPSVEAITLTLESGVEISVGTPTGIASKEAIVEQLMAKYPGKLTYINVRVPSNPSYRMIDSDTVQQGTGVMGDVTAEPEPEPGEASLEESDQFPEAAAGEDGDADVSIEDEASGDTDAGAGESGQTDESAADPSAGDAVAGGVVEVQEVPSDEA